MPVTVDSGSGLSAALNQIPQRKTFKIGSYWFLLWSDGTNLVYKSTTNPADWSGSKTTLISGIAKGQYFAARYAVYNSTDYVYLAYVLSDVDNGSDVYFCRCTVSNGTLTAGTSYTVYAKASGARMSYPDVHVGTNGYAHVGFSRGETTGTKLLRWMVRYCTSNDGNGTWSGANFSIATAAGDLYWAYGGLAQLTSGKMYTAYCSDAVVWIRGALFSGDPLAWGSYETILASDCAPTAVLCLLGTTDDVGLSYSKGSTSYQYFKYRTYGTGWGSEETIEDYACVTAATLTLDSSVWYAFWVISDEVWRNSRVSGSWGTPEKWVDGETDPLSGSLTSDEFDRSDLIGVAWVRGIGTQYIRYATLDLAPPKPPILVQII